MANVPYLFINVFAFLCFTLMSITFFAAEKSQEIKAWLLLLLDMTVWTGSSVLMRLQVYPGLTFWYYVSLLSLFLIAFLTYNFVFCFARAKGWFLRLFWAAGTLVILIFSAQGVFLKPPTPTQTPAGTVFTYIMDWKIGIPLVFLLLIVFSIVRLLKQIAQEKGMRAPGVAELMIGCVIIAAGNIAQIFPGNIFPWDTLSGIVFAMFMIISLYRRRMFKTSRMISRSVITGISMAIILVAATVVVQPLADFVRSVSYADWNASAITFVLLTAAVLGAIVVVNRMFSAVFADDNFQSAHLKQFSAAIERTLSVDDILKEMMKTVRGAVPVRQAYVCLLLEGRYVPVFCAMPLQSTDFSIPADSPCVEYLRRPDNARLVLREFVSNSMYKSVWAAEKKLYDALDLSYIFALKDGDDIVGLVLLSDKIKGTKFTYDDLSDLDTICSIASIAVKKAVLYEQVAAREHLFNSMTAFIPDVIFIKERGRDSLCFVSANTRRVLGLSAEYFERHSIYDIVSECLGGDYRRQIREHFGGGTRESYYFETEFTQRDTGTHMNLRVGALPIISDGEVSHYAIVVNDVTADIEARHLLMSSMEGAQSANRAKSDFLSHMSHEIRTPLNAIIGETYLARELAEERGEAELSDRLRQIDQSSQYLLEVLNNVIDISKIESGKQELQHVPFDIVKTFREIVSVYTAQARMHEVKFESECDGMEFSGLIGDEVALMKILNNLLSNALKFTPKGGTVRLRAKQKQLSRGTVLMRIWVMDTGIGMSPEFQQHIFDPFTQEFNQMYGKHNGSGLGMAICKNMVDMMGGSIEVSSRPGKGTHFMVEINYDVDFNSSGVQPEEAEVDFSVLENRRVLVVEDVDFNARIVEQLLARKKLRAEIAQNGRIAVERMEDMPENWYDLILMDIRMPEMNGLQAAKAIRAMQRADARTIPIVAMSADAFTEDIQRSYQCGMNAHLTKPINPHALYSTLASLIVKRDAAEPEDAAETE